MKKTSPEEAAIYKNIIINLHQGEKIIIPPSLKETIVGQNSHQRKLNRHPKKSASEQTTIK